MVWALAALGFVVFLVLALFLFRYLFGRRLLFVKDTQGDYLVYKVKKITDEYVHTRCGKQYPLGRSFSLDLPFPLMSVRCYGVDFTDDEVRADWGTMQLFMANGFIREISLQVLDVFGVASVGLLIVVIVLVGLVLSGHGTINEGLQNILSLFSGPGAN